jgi:hypothetical protein
LFIILSLPHQRKKKYWKSWPLQIETHLFLRVGSWGIWELSYWILNNFIDESDTIS